MNKLKRYKRKGFKGIDRLGEERLNKQGCLMKIIEYNGNNDIIVEFQDEYKAKVHTQYRNFQIGDTKNPYHPNVYGVGVVGNKYSSRINGVVVREYDIWTTMLARCYDQKFKEKNPTYKNVTCCDEWLNYENFYEWLHSQENYNQWYNGKKWCVDKDILIKGNKVYSPDTCCLVPHDINCLFLKCEAKRGDLPIGVCRSRNKLKAHCRNPFTKKLETFGNYRTAEEAFYLGYKPYKENIIKQVAENEYLKGNIVKKCYDAMINYEVEITD